MKEKLLVEIIKYLIELVMKGENIYGEYFKIM